eukprot:GFYU01010056.1.p1 GENE.GFYU01010056.1~~GFYU01010056.1.p1  ORF type:complete len:180 (+),score=63.85 GFYU01010056.1:89-628(+)
MGKKDDAPVEMSATKPVKQFADFHKVKPQKKNIRDPRFEDLCGEYNENSFRDAFKFVENYQSSELVDLKKQLKKAKGVDAKAEIQAKITQLEQKVGKRKKEDHKKKLKANWRKEELKRVKEGKKPYFLKKSDEKKLEMIEKYKKLKDTGGLDKYIEKRRKRLSSKQHTSIPRRRNVGDE